ncbi:polysaccharide pyruvyl transferase family protein [Methylotenera sp.]|uniref:polysaccharide pyruvyl transferase family protein n=1 Tax=Methylotenera sp. TaxID=2051956 RepID=UPI0027321A58|nr:polysaccharide pyruvyl transferase family protein [Methylotenera sp.]MDP2229628.1 polysaccharide pyruvyl transferase family protein [Methylotenera sp.]
MQTTFQTNAASAINSDDIWGGRQLIGELQAKARAVLDPLIPASASVALLDYPNYSNVGDSLIWLGEMIYLRSRKIQPTYVCDFKNYRSESLLHSLGNPPVILLQGGGNFGSLWKTIHDSKLQVLKDFKGIPVIQLPQSIHFNDDVVLEKTKQAISQHGNFTLVVRDQPSYDFATNQFDCKVLLCPDMAFFIGPISSIKHPKFDRFILSRTDHEKSNNWIDDLSRLDTGITVDQNDWLDQQAMEKILNRIQQHTSGFRSVVDPSNKALLLLWNALAKARLARGKALLERGRVVISDRLHVHILSILLNKPHVLIDNSYGKLGNFHQAWTTHYRGVKFVCNLEAALDAASNFDAQMHRLNSMASA